MGFFDDVANKSALSSKLNKLNMSAKENYNQLGTRYYNLYKDNPDPIFKELVDAITLTCAEIKQTEKELALLRGMVICPNCNTECSVNINYCTKCGTKLIKPEPPKPVQSPVMQAPVQSVQNIVQQPVQPAQVQPTVQPPVVDINSGSVLQQSSGATEENVKQETVAVEQVESEPEFKFCTQCGNKVKFNAMFCTKCGTGFNK